MKELVQYIAASLVSQPDRVQVEVDDRGHRVGLRLSVASEDMGRVIGRRGRVANAMRTLLRVMGARRQVRVDMDIE
ncbi:MAG: KH domain-containing protein [Anaerolineales bacterium]|jgi:hypothetical protein|nr:RNA-binding protein [Anaerolineaceae bacterium]MDP7345806.1 KH domain-containing protein [Anaerolineales bacterium]MDP7644204.1 KH domain-containing protein [Anaerolineales bacterium]HJN41427.1 KH domain-containing protein [Anaerolineales bacterium]|tara:strand:+ start:1770 stop:1997 length:228 start_codon:yes stop_codon:yes gene_type:complete